MTTDILKTKMTTRELRHWLVFLAGDTVHAHCQFRCRCEACSVLDSDDAYFAHMKGARIPRSLRRYIRHPSWSIDPNYVKLRKLVREGRRIADAWERQRETVKICVEKAKP